MKTGSNFKRSSKNWLVFFCTSLIISSLVISCSAHPRASNGTTFLASLGIPAIQSLAWSPVNENEILVTTSSGMHPGPASAYIINIKTGHHEVIAKSKGGGYFIESRWLPDGKNILIRSWENTIGFEPSGWWQVDVKSKAIEYVFDDLPASWSPNGNTIASFSWMEGKNGLCKYFSVISRSRLASEKRNELIWRLP